MDTPGLVNILSWRSLTDAIKTTKVLEPWLLNLLCRTKIPHATNRVDIELITSKARLAQFVNENEGPLDIERLSKIVKIIELPKTWEKFEVTAKQLADIKQLTDNLYEPSAQTRAANANEYIMTLIDELKNRVYNRREQMLCEGLSTGKVSVSQDNVAFEIDYGYVTDVHKQTISASTDKWSDKTNSNPLKDIMRWSKEILRTCGYKPDYCILGEEASAAFQVNTNVMKALNNLNYKVGQMDLTQTPSNAGLYLGTFTGGVKVF